MDVLRRISAPTFLHFVGFGCWRQMAPQIHAVVKHAQHIDDVFVTEGINPEYYEVSSLAPFAGDRESVNARTDVFSRADTQD